MEARLLTEPVSETRQRGMMRRHIGFCLLFLCMSTQVWAQDPLDRLLKSLEGMAWPFDYTELLSLEEPPHYERQVGAVLEILDRREAIHSRPEIDDFRKTQIVCNALQLLDAYDLPLVEQILARLSEEEDWRPREKALLAYLCAKRDIHYEPNVAYLMERLTLYETDLESPANRNVAWTVRGTCDTLSYLADLFIQKGDERILGDLFAYTSVAFGYPAEFFSDRLVRMLLKRPDLFISCLARTRDETVRDVTGSIGFGIRNDSIRKDLDEALQDKLDRVEGREREAVVRLRKEVEALRRQWAREPVASRP